MKLIVDTKAKIMYVYKHDKLIKKINNVWIGKKGASSKIYEGSMKTPKGIFNLGIAFGTHDLDINYPYIKINENLFWVDDTSSKYYNNLVSLKNIDTYNYPYIVKLNKKEFTSAEHLLDYQQEYEYAIYIEYNTECKKGKGSAIFLHCHGNKGYTLGCIAIHKEDMLFILKNLDRSSKILIK